MKNLPKLLIVLGPTATGKTDLAIILARKFNGELVACDSRQVYRGLDIGTGKLPSNFKKFQKGDGYWDVDGIKIWLYDVVSPKKQFSVSDYVKKTELILKDIEKRGKLPIIVGGTGFYLKALIEGLSDSNIPIDKKLKKELESLSLSQLQERLKKLSVKRLEALNESDIKNPRRLIRAIEIVSAREIKKESPYISEKKKYQTLKIGLTAPREVLYERVDKRILTRLDQGMILEAENLKKLGISLKRMRQLGLEYGVLADFLDEKIKNVNELVGVMKGKIHGYVRRQLTWFKRESDIYWYDVTDMKTTGLVEKKVIEWYDHPS